MDSIKRKMNKILDELVAFLFSVGSDNVKLELKKETDGYSLRVNSNFAPEHRRQVEKLERLLHPTDRYEGLEHFYWELAGNSGIGQDSELQLVGQMLDHADITIVDNTLELFLVKHNN